jgi:hypothetical protein
LGGFSDKYEYAKFIIDFTLGSSKIAEIENILFNQQMPQSNCTFCFSLNDSWKLNFHLLFFLVKKQWIWNFGEKITNFFVWFSDFWWYFCEYFDRFGNGNEDPGDQDFCEFFILARRTNIFFFCKKDVWICNFCKKILVLRARLGDPKVIRKPYSITLQI